MGIRDLLGEERGRGPTMPSSGASAAPGAPDEDPSLARCIALYAWFFPIAPSPPGPARPDWNRKGRGGVGGRRSLSFCWSGVRVSACRELWLAGMVGDKEGGTVDMGKKGLYLYRNQAI